MNEDYFDISYTVGELYPRAQPPEWPMYSFDRPSRMLWSAVGKRMFELGWAEAEIKYWLQSKETRWALDNALGDAIEALGELAAESAKKPKAQ